MTLRAVLFDVDFTLARPGPDLQPQGYVRISERHGLALDMRDFARHHALEIDAGISSFQHGKTKPHGSIFRAVLELLEVEPHEAAMVGDTVEDDIEGALALGMQAVLVDRLGLRPDYEPRIDTLYALPALLGLPRL